MSDEYDVVDVEKLLNYIEKNGFKNICSLCSQPTLNASPNKAYHLGTFTKTGLSFTGPWIPLVPITCSNCGHTILINAIIADLLKDEVADYLKGVEEKKDER